MSISLQLCAVEEEKRQIVVSGKGKEGAREGVKVRGNKHRGHKGAKVKRVFERTF